MRQIECARHKMFRTSDTPNPELDAYVEKNAKLVDAYAAATFGDDEEAAQLTSFFVHTAADVVWERSSDRPRPCWSRLDVGLWLRSMEQGADREMVTLGAWTLLGFLVWCVDERKLDPMRVMPVIRQLERRARKRARRLGMQLGPASVADTAAQRWN